jgi:glucose-6-phosphate isomerase
MKPSDAATRIDWLAGKIQGTPMQSSIKKLGQLDGVFRDRNAWQAMNPETLVYSVQWHDPVPQDTEGGLFWGTTTIEPGRVGGEYFMTRGHFHSKRDRAEYYCTVQGEGMLVLMDEDRSTRVETMSAGSLHYIPGHTSHRTVNTGDTPLSFWACWPSDAGHDYDTIAKHPFTARILDRDGAPEVVRDEPRR